MLISNYITPVMYIDPSGESFIVVFLVLTAIGFVLGGGSQYFANALNGKEGSDRWEGVLGAAVGGAIALPSLMFSGGTYALFALGSGIANGVINEIERSKKYNQDFNVLSAAYDSTIYSLLNFIPFVKGVGGAVFQTFLIDSTGFFLADRYKDMTLAGFEHLYMRKNYNIENRRSDTRFDWSSFLSPRTVRL